MVMIGQSYRRTGGGGVHGRKLYHLAIRRHSPDIALLDIVMPRRASNRIARLVLDTAPNLPLMIAMMI